jgi:hypothetical protein
MWSALPVVELSDLISPDPVERGLYVARSQDVTPAHVLSQLVSLLAYESRDVETAPARTGQLRYTPNRAWRRCSRIGHLIWMDTNHSFDTQHVISESRKAKLEPTRILRTVKVWRPYDALQLVRLLDRIPNPALWAPNTSKGDILNRSERGDLSGSQALWWTPLIIIPDMLSMFCDEKLSEMQMVSLYRSFVIQLSFLRQRAIVLGLFNETALPANRRPLLAEVIKMSRRVLPFGAGDLAQRAVPSLSAVQSRPWTPVESRVASLSL